MPVVMHDVPAGHPGSVNIDIKLVIGQTGHVLSLKLVAIQNGKI